MSSFSRQFNTTPSFRNVGIFGILSGKKHLTINTILFKNHRYSVLLHKYTSNTALRIDPKDYSVEALYILELLSVLFEGLRRSETAQNHPEPPRNCPAAAPSKIGFHSFNDFGSNDNCRILQLSE